VRRGWGDIVRSLRRAPHGRRALQRLARRAARGRRRRRSSPHRAAPRHGPPRVISGTGPRRAV